MLNSSTLSQPLSPPPAKKRPSALRIWGRVLQRIFLALYKQRLMVLLVLVLGIVAGGYLFWRSVLTMQASLAGTFPVEVTVQNIRQQGSSLLLTLQEKGGQRSIAMAISTPEAFVIARERGQRIPGEQLRAYDLMRDVVQTMGGRVDRVVVNDADQREYFAQVIVSMNGDQKVVKARPADAVALALKAGAPVFVEDHVLDQFGTRSSG